MKRLNRRQFAKTIASGIGVLSTPMGFALPIQQAHPAPFTAEQRHYSLENKFGISLTLDTQEGFYTVQHGGEHWLGRGLVSVLENKRWYRSDRVKYPEVAAYDRTTEKLALTGVKTGTSTNCLGTYQSIEVTWQVPDSATAF